MIKLKPCPFCGETESTEIEEFTNSYGKPDGFDIGCINIHCIFQPEGWAIDKEEAIKIWNQRK